MITTETPYRDELQKAQRAALAMMVSASDGAHRSCIGHQQAQNRSERRFYFGTYLQFTVDWRSARAEYDAITAELATLCD